MKVAIVGCGGIGRRYASILADITNVVAVCDPDGDRAAEAAGACGAKPYSSLEEALEHEDFDTVFICTSTRFHKPVFLSAVEAGKRIFLEKPMSESLDDAMQMVDAHGGAGKLTFGFGFKLRFEGIFALARQIVKSGEIGQVRTMAFTYSQSLPSGDRIWYVDSGILNEMHIHGLDLVTWWAGVSPREVSAKLGRSLGRQGEDSAWTELHYDNGARAVVHGGYYPDFPNVSGRSDISFQIMGTKGHIVGYRPDTVHVVSPKRTETLIEPLVDPFVTELRAFVAAVEKGEPAPVSGEAGLLAQKVITAAKRSDTMNGPVALSDL